MSIARLTSARVAYLERQELDEHGLRLPPPGEQLGLDLEAYMGEGERVVGRWQGAGAEALGLGEAVRAGELAVLLAGANPQTGELLGRRFVARSRLVAVTDSRSGERVLTRQQLDEVGGWDLVFAAPKSVSLAYALGENAVRSAVLAAHEAAVTAVLGLLERHAAYVRRGRNGVILERAAGIVVARFDHELARRVEHANGTTTTDPHLHTHCALLGKALSGDGEWRALRHPLIIGEWQKPLGAAYRAHLRAEITERLGWGWVPLDERGFSELAGWSAEVLSEMSQRRRQVERHLEAAWGTTEGLTGYQTRAAAVETRVAKSPAVAFEELQADWRARLEEHGLQRETLVALVSPAEFRAAPLAYSPDELEVVFARLAGEWGLTERGNTFTRASVIRGLADALPGGASAAVLEGFADRFLADRGVVLLAPLLGSAYEGVERYTTRGLLELEHATLTLARAPVERHVGELAEHVVINASRRASARLSHEQCDALAQVARSGRPVELVDAAAGTGKTTLLGELASVYRGQGYVVVGLAPSARAAVELEQAGVESRTIDSHLYRLQHDRPRAAEGEREWRGRLVIVDEAGMVGTRNLARLLAEERGRGSKVVLAGDPSQLPSVAAGGVFHELCKQDEERIRLRGVLRQRDPLEVAALAALRSDAPGRDGIEVYLEHKARRGEITITHDQHDALASARAWWTTQLEQGREPREVAVISRTNQLRSVLNRELRAVAAERGLLDGPEYRVRPERAGQAELLLRVGDRLVLRENNRQPWLVNGMLGTVEHVSERGDGLSLRLDQQSRGALRVAVPTWYLKAGYAEHAYAITGHASQGVTLERALVVTRPEDHSREWTYTTASRTRGETQHLIVDDQTGARDDPEHDLTRPDRATPSRNQRKRRLEVMSRLGHALGRSEAERLATLQQTRGQEFGQLPADLRDPRFELPASLSLDYGLGRHRGDRGQDLPDLGR